MRHKHIVEVKAFSLGTEKGIPPHLVMELMDESLYEYIGEMSTGMAGYDFSDALSIIHDICQVRECSALNVVFNFKSSFMSRCVSMYFPEQYTSKYNIYV